MSRGLASQTAVVGAAAFSMGAAFAQAPPAAAHTGSTEFDNDGTWTDEEWIGASYDTSGNHILFFGVGLLTGFYNPSLCENGLWDTDTETGIEEYQGDHSLTVDGIVGPNTWTSMKDHIGGTTFIGDGWYQHFMGEAYHPGGSGGLGHKVYSGNGTWKRFHAEDLYGEEYTIHNTDHDYRTGYPECYAY